MFKRSKVIKRLGAGFTASLCALSMTLQVSAEAIETMTQSLNDEYVAYVSETSFPTLDEVVLTASKYLGVKYVNLGTTPSGFDCSGFILYIMKEMGYKTTGFNRNIPVPRSTYDWITVSNPTIQYKDSEVVNIAFEKFQEDLPGGNNDVEGKTRNYWECADGSTISPGSVVVAHSTGNASDGHCWIYLGEFNGANEVREYLRSIGVADSVVDSTNPYNIVEYPSTRSNYAGNHWRIECFDGGRVVIDNGFELELSSTDTSSLLAATVVSITKNDSKYKITKHDNKGNVIGKLPVDGTTAKYGVYWIVNTFLNLSKDSLFYVLMVSVKSYVLQEACPHS